MLCYKHLCLSIIALIEWHFPITANYDGNILKHPPNLQWSNLLELTNIFLYVIGNNSYPGFPVKFSLYEIKPLNIPYTHIIHILFHCRLNEQFRKLGQSWQIFIKYNALCYVHQQHIIFVALLDHCFICANSMQWIRCLTFSKVNYL